MAFQCRPKASPPTQLPIVMVTVDGPAITEKEKEVENLDFLGEIVKHIPKFMKSNRSWQMFSLQGHTRRLHWPTTEAELSK